MPEKFEYEVEKRNQLFLLAEELGNVTQACKIMAVDKGRYYNFKEAYDQYGVDGLKGDRSNCLRHVASEKDKDEIINGIIEYVINNPKVGSRTIRNMLLEEGRTYSKTAIQKFLNDKKLGTILDRIYELERRAFREDYDLTESQCELLEKYDPCMKEWKSESGHPGEKLVQCITKMQITSDCIPIFAHFVIDRYGSLAFLLFDKTESIDVSIKLLDKFVFPYYDDLEIEIKEITLEAEDEPNKKSLNSYGMFTHEHGIAATFIESSDEDADGFAQRFKAIVRDQLLFDRRTKLYLKEIEEINEKCQIWLNQYNSNAHNGYRNFGAPPFEVIKAYRAGRRII
jgi:hypothetical protein